MKEYVFEVLPEESGRRIDILIAEHSRTGNLGLSREAVQKIIMEGNVILNGQDSRIKPHYKTKCGDVVVVRIEEKKPLQLSPEDIGLNVVYEDDCIAVIDKPVGLVVHPAPGNYEHTLVNALLHRFKNLSDINPERPGIVHRLDKDTSGVLVIAKNNAAHLSLARQFAEHSIKRKYVAVVRGRMEFNESIIELPIGRHPIKRKDMAVDFGSSAKYARTHYRVLKRKEDVTLLELEPFTGRTHQLRVHLSHIGHPIMGDVKYGKNNRFSRLALHAAYLGFVHPCTEKFIEFASEAPAEFNELIRKR